MIYKNLKDLNEAFLYNNLVLMFLTFAGQRFLIFNRLRAIWPKGYKRGNERRFTRTATT